MIALVRVKGDGVNGVKIMSSMRMRRRIRRHAVTDKGDREDRRQDAPHKFHRLQDIQQFLIFDRGVLRLAQGRRRQV